MKRAAWIGSLACLPAWALAAIPYVYPFNAMTGQEVIEQRLKEPRTQLDYINREKVDAYLNGIKDGAHGRDWCLAQPLLPQELNVALVRRLQATRRPAELRQNAAPLVLAELRRRFPCTKAVKTAGTKVSSNASRNASRNAKQPPVKRKRQPGTAKG